MIPENNDKELFDMWQAATLSDPNDAARLARAIERRTLSFDRTVYWRNFREYAAGVAITICFLVLAVRFPPLRLTALAGLAAISVVLFSLWRSHRHHAQPDDTADLQSFHAALLARYDHQIRLLRGVKYWYVLPQYLWLLLVVIQTPASRPAARATLFLLSTAIMAFVVWLNQSYGVRRLQREKQKALEMLKQD